MEQSLKNGDERPRKKVQRHSPLRLLRKPVELPGGSVVKAELHNGQIKVRIEWPPEEA